MKTLLNRTIYTLALLGLAGLLLAACDDNSTGPAPEATLSRLGSVQVDNIQGTSGYDSVVVTFDGTWLKFFTPRHGFPNELIVRDSVSLAGAFTLSHLTAIPQWVLVSALEGVSMVPLFAPRSLSLQIMTPGTAESRAMVTGNNLLITDGTGLELYDITALASPNLIDTATSGATVRGIAPLTDAFFLFTDSGYAVLDVSDTANVTLTETNDSVLNRFSFTDVDGDTLYAAGPDATPATSKLAVLNVANPDTPLVIDTAFVQGEFTAYHRAVRDGFWSTDERESFLLTDATLNLYRLDGGELKYTRYAAWNYTLADYRGFMTWNERFYMGIAPSTLDIYRWLK